MKIQPVLNVPMQLALKDPAGDYHPEAEEVIYLTTDGRELVLETRTAERLNALFLRPGEAFHLCRRWDNQRGTLPRFDFWLSPASEKARAAEESAQGERQPAASEPAQGTGTYGPAPKILTAPIPARLPAMARPGRVPYNVAFREIVGFVISELKASGEQWTDQSRQGLVSTVIISASRQGLLDIWERPQ